VYIYRNVALDTDGSFIGYGFPNSLNSNNRFIQEATVAATAKIWGTEERESILLSLQATYKPGWRCRDHQQQLSAET
jgi:hypothetical protein